MVLVIVHRDVAQLRSSDGINYATVARNVMAGRGLVSSVVQPGLIDVVPSDRRGQAFVIQAPLWPVVLGGWFKLFGASATSVAWLGGLLTSLAVLGAWWLGWLLSGSASVGYLAAVMTLLNPHLLSGSMAGVTTSFQALLFVLVFLVLYLTPTPWRVVLTGLLLGVAILTRENSVFLLGGAAFSWYASARRRAGGTGPLGLGSWRGVAVFVVALTVAGGLVTAAATAEARRKAELIGDWDAPTVRMTFLYDTPVGNRGWYFIHGYEGLGISPARYFLDHPTELVRKVAYQLAVAFAEQTLPALLSTTPWFVPVVVPWMFTDPLARRFGASVLVVLGLQTVIGSPSSLHFSYYFAFLPVLYPLVATSIVMLSRRLGRRRPEPRRVRVLCAVLIVYALVPAVLNAGSLVAGGPLRAGDYDLTPSQERRLASLIIDNTAPGAVIVSSHAPLLAWTTGRTVIQYSGAAAYRISDSEMWRRIDRRLPIDAIMLTSLAGERPDMPLLPGFRLVRRLDDPDLGAWLFARVRDEPIPGRR